MVIGFGKLQAAAVPQGSDVGLVGLLDPVDDRVAVADAERVAGPGDDPLDEVLVDSLGVGSGQAWSRRVRGRRTRSPLVGARRRVEDDDVADRGIGEVVEEAVDEDPLADVEGRLHRLGGDLVRLDQPGLDAERQAQRQRDDHDQLDQPAGAALRLGDRGFSPSPRRSRRPPRTARSSSAAASSSVSPASASADVLGSASASASGRLCGLSRSAPPRSAPRPPAPPRPRRLAQASSASAPRRGLLGLGLRSLDVAFLDRGLVLADALGVERLGLVGLGGPAPRSAPRRSPSAARRRGRPCRSGRAGSRAWPGARRRGGDLELLDLRRVQRERPLDADAEGLLADGEGLARARALALEDDALEDLGAAAVALDHLEVDAHAVARGEGGKALLQLGTLDAVDDAAH